jgi:hypothetical protein
MLVKEMLWIQLCNHAQKMIGYAVNHSAMMFWQLKGQLPYRILFKHFSEDQIENSTYQVDDSRTN